MEYVSNKQKIIFTKNYKILGGEIMSYDICAGMLRMMDEFHKSNKKIRLQYEKSEKLKELAEKYHLEEIAKEEGTIKKIQNILTWFSKHVCHNEEYDGKIKNNAEQLLEYSFDQGVENGLNSRSLSIALTECYLALGLWARSIYLMPFSPYDNDNHVVVEIWVGTLSKWVMVDPTYGGYIMNQNGTILNVMELRKVLALREKVVFSEGFHHNDEKNLNFEEICSYYAKNLFYLKCREIQGYNSEHREGNRIVVMAPVGFDVKKNQLVNIDYRISQFGDGEWLRNWKEAVENGRIFYQNPDLFLYQMS